MSGVTILTEDGKELREGDRAYNYYDMKPGTIRLGSLTTDPDSGFHGWFTFDHDAGGHAILNGARICSTQFAKSRGFPGA